MMDATPSVPTVPQAAPPQYNKLISDSLDQVTLNVSGQKFTTTINILVGKSLFFAQLLQGDWKSFLQEDDSIFVDSDPDVFQHVLQYLRRGVFPLIHDQKKGHNYKLYADILAEARYFSIAG
ncbi:hypothetical protein QBC36DRAFT_216321 [Triangularia setosa]|uniref:BTB domain-containing protein n=1 Tax=Triangularia setosa TaxID=2587417 RepID=A0AAN7A7N7_9PEZI|nr:hypothetical protein QBC36DRAFT_216321 [Podospora setosa]